MKKEEETMTRQGDFRIENSINEILKMKIRVFQFSSQTCIIQKAQFNVIIIFVFNCFLLKVSQCHFIVYYRKLGLVIVIIRINLSY